MPAMAPNTLIQDRHGTLPARGSRTRNSSRRGARRARVLPGFGLTLGYTMLYLSLLVLIPAVGGVHPQLGTGLGALLEAVTSRRGCSPRCA